MLKALKFVARLLAAIPKFTLRWCARAGDFILECLPPYGAPAEVTTAAGEEAQAAMELDQARQERKMMPQGKSQVVLAYAAAVVAGGTPPNLSKLPIPFVRWLEDLQPAQCRQILKCSVAQIEAHLDPKRPSDKLEFLPSVSGAQPAKAASQPQPGRYAKPDANAKIRLVDAMFSELIEEMEEKSAKPGLRAAA